VAQHPLFRRAAAQRVQEPLMAHYAALETPWEKTFFFLPLGHAEETPYLETAVELAEELVAQAPPELRRILEHSAAQARGHRDVIARFGRQPHRNAVLGRQSTPEELAYLASGRLVHTRPPPRQRIFRTSPLPRPTTRRRDLWGGRTGERPVPRAYPSGK
jgi:Bacterial protein of unknown function (DUF924)